QIQENMKILSNLTSKSPTFLLTAIPGFQSAHAWISVPFCCLYAVALSGNSIILFIIVTQHSLHEPMFYFLSMLSATDLGLTLSTMSTTLGILWFDARKISLDACITQMFFLHQFTVMESGGLVIMAFDHYVAICNPLRYTTDLPSFRTIQMGLFMILRTVTTLTPLLLLFKALSFYRMNVLSHSHCYHPEQIASIYHASPCLQYHFSRRKIQGLQHLCLPHWSSCCILHPMISLSLIYCYSWSFPKVVHLIMTNVCLLLLPALNPIIYSVKTRHIHKVVFTVLLTK
uniref:Olfactory receptor family 51 subfamily F member 1 n=1 Tax=Chinchilla lanigera TaxID=34839 RepID=A0A8C2W2L9_CHILA